MTLPDVNEIVGVVSSPPTAVRSKNVNRRLPVPAPCVPPPPLSVSICVKPATVGTFVSVVEFDAIAQINLSPAAHPVGYAAVVIDVVPATAVPHPTSDTGGGGGGSSVLYTAMIA